MTKVNQQYYDMVGDPDTFYDSESDSITFIYDPSNGEFSSAPYPTTHGGIRRSNPDWKGFYDNETSIDNGLILGRLGNRSWRPNARNRPKEGGEFKTIAFWNVHFKNNELVDCLNAVVKEHPEYGSPDTIVMSDKYGRYDLRPANFSVALLGEIPGVKISKRTQKQSRTQERPECAATLDVKGVPTDLSTILGNFHMVKDDRLPAMKAAICSQGPALRQKLEKLGCDLQVRMIDELLEKAQCNKGGEYDSLKQGGRIARKQELQKIFADPESMSRNFRTQKELDAAWDELQGKKEHRMHGFKTFVQKFL